MKWLKFLLATLIIWLLTQIIIWGFSEIVLDDSGLAHTVGLEEVDIWLRILVYALFPLPLAFVFARRLVSGPRSGK